MKQISCSWDFGSGPNSTTEQFFQRFAAQGQSFFDASGDVGAYAGAIPFPDDDPNITIVGGTALATSEAGGWRVGETVWNSSGGAASSGGFSSYYPLPTWQQGISMDTNGGSSTTRNIPDVSMVADNIFIVADNGHSEAAGGTSAAAPLGAAFTALVNQQAAAKDRPAVGFLKPALYALGKGPNASASFADIVTGNNINSDPAQFPAAAGFDLCTGWGTSAGMSLLLELGAPDPMNLNPGNGFVSRGPTGGPFDTAETSFVITDAGPGALNWSLGNLPAWLSGSAASGAIAAGDSTAVTIRLSDAAQTLVQGNYGALIWFTNLTSGVAQARPFTLIIGGNMVQNAGFEAGDFSWWNLAGTDPALFNFADTGSGSGITPHSGGYCAALGQTNSLAFLSQVLPTCAGQPYLLAFWFKSVGPNGPPNEFRVDWDAAGPSPTTLVDWQNLGVFDWTRYQYLVVGAGPTTTLMFGFQNDLAYFGLDDVSAIPVPAPALRGATRLGDQITFSWSATPGVTYQVQCTTDLTQAQWFDLGSPITATASSANSAHTIGPDSQRFYRVELVAPQALH